MCMKNLVRALSLRHSVAILGAKCGQTSTTTCISRIVNDVNRTATTLTELEISCVAYLATSPDATSGLNCAR